MTTANSETCCKCGHSVEVHMGPCYHVMAQSIPLFDCHCDQFETA